MALAPRAINHAVLVLCLFAWLPAFGIHKDNPGSSQNGETTPIPNCPAPANTPNFAVLDGSANCGFQQGNNSVVTLVDANRTFSLTITPALWTFENFSQAKTIFNVQLTNLTPPNQNITLSLQSLVIGTAMNDAAYVICDSSGELQNVNGVNYCTTSGFFSNGINEAVEPTPITAADYMTTRWDFYQLSAPPGSTSGTLSLVADCVPQEFAQYYTDSQGNAACLNSLSFGNTQFLAIVLASNSQNPITAGTLQLESAPPAGNDTVQTATPIPASADGFTDFINTSNTNPQEVLSGSGAGGMIPANGQGDPVPPCSNSNSQSVFRSVWYTFTPTNSSLVRISTDGSRFDTLLSVFPGNPQNKAIACNDDSTLAGPYTLESSDVSFTSVAGQQYYIMVSEFPPDVGTLNHVQTAIPLSNDATLRFKLTQGHPVPFVDIVQPVSVLPGTRVPSLTIQGAGFADGATVNLNGSTLTPSSVFPNEIIVNNVTVPNNNSTVPVSVVNPNTSPQVSSSNLTYLPLTNATSSVILNNSENHDQEQFFAPLVADFTNTGKLDLAFVDESSNVVVVLGNGNGTFQVPVSYPVGSDPFSLAIGDFNGDGKPDLVVANLSDGTIQVLLGNGDGTFDVQPPLTNYSNPGVSFIAVGDFNGDGWLDLAVLNSTQLSVLLGNGDGTFTAGNTYAESANLNYAIAGDFNADGKLDLALLTSASNVLVLLGNGDGSFQSPIVTQTGPTPIYATAGDFNGDGRLDLAVANTANSGGGSVSVLLGNNTGGFSRTDYQLGSATSVVTGDLNGDGRPDLLVSTGIGQLDLLLGNGDGTFQNAIPFNDPNAPLYAVLGDFNNDGRLDAIASGGIEFDVFLQQTPKVSLSPSSLTFPDQAVATTSPAKNVQLTNTGSAPLNITSISASGDYAQTNNCVNPINPGSACTIKVTLSPTNIGSLSGAITLVDDASIAPQIVGLSGKGVQAVGFSPHIMTFGTVAVGSTSMPQTETLTNREPTTLNFSFVASGSYAAVGSGSSPCGTSLPAGAKCTMSVTFSPKANGNIDGTVTVSDHTAIRQQLIELSGIGTGGGKAPLTFNPMTLNFTSQAFNTTSAPQPVTVTNTSTMSLTISSIVASGNFKVSGSGTKPCQAGTVLGANASCTLNVTFAPTQTGTITGGVAISDNASVGQQVLDVTGAGVLPVTFNAYQFRFVTQDVGTTSLPQTVTMTNNLGKNLNNVNISVSADFGVTNNLCPTTLPAHGQCTFDVIFTPSQVGSIIGAVTVGDSAISNPQIIGLTGTGQ